MNKGLHHTGECGEALCLLARQEEIDLELPSDPVERQRWYSNQRMVYTPWLLGIRNHKWRFRLKGKCRNCEALGLTVISNGQQLCIQWCLSTLLPWYPTGGPQPTMAQWKKHLTHCTSHSSSLTSVPIALFGKQSMSSSRQTAELLSKSTFFLGKTKTEPTSFADMLSLNLGL